MGLDKGTYDKYQSCSDPVLRPALQQLVTINPDSASEEHYATFVTSGARCGFLSEGLCSIQKNLGEEYLGKACAAFPRVSNLVNGVVERSLDMSCPEAARLALLDPEPLRYEFVQASGAAGLTANTKPGIAQPNYGRIANTVFSAGSERNAGGVRGDNVRLIRSFVFALLQNRKFRLPQRLALLAHACDELNEIASEGKPEMTRQSLDGLSFAIDAGCFDAELQRCPADPARQFSIVIELIQERITSDYTHKRFLQLYEEFLSSVRPGADAEMEEMVSRYAEGRREYFEPFMKQHEYMLEHYLVNNAFKALFPFGSRTVNAVLNLPAVKPVAEQYMVMISYYAIVRGLLVGLAGAYKRSFGADQVIRCIQLCSKTFEHSVSYPARALNVLAKNGISDCRAMAVLTQD